MMTCCRQAFGQAMQAPLSQPFELLPGRRTCDTYTTGMSLNQRCSTRNWYNPLDPKVHFEK